MPPSLKGCLKPDFHDFQRDLQSYQALAKTCHIGVVVLAGKPRALRIPADGATNASHFVGDDCFAVSRPAQNYSALTISASHRLRGGTNKKRIIDSLGTGGSKIANLMSQIEEQLLDLLFVLEACVIRGQRDFHSLAVPNGSLEVLLEVPDQLFMHRIDFIVREGPFRAAISERISHALLARWNILSAEDIEQFY